MDRLVTIKSNRYGMELRMNPDVPFEEIQKAVVEKFTDAAGFFKNARMAISFTGRTLTATEEEILIQTITETTGVELLCIIDQDEKKELMYRSIVEQTLSNIQPIYRSGKVSSIKGRSESVRYWKVNQVS